MRNILVIFKKELKSYFASPIAYLLLAIFAVIFLHERPSLPQWLGIGLVGAGIVILGLKR